MINSPGRLPVFAATTGFSSNAALPMEGETLPGGPLCVFIQRLKPPTATEARVMAEAPHRPQTQCLVFVTAALLILASLGYSSITAVWGLPSGRAGLASDAGLCAPAPPPPIPHLDPSAPSKHCRPFRHADIQGPSLPQDLCMCCFALITHLSL